MATICQGEHTHAVRNVKRLHHLTNRLLRHRMNEIGSDITHRLQNETTLNNTLVGNYQIVKSLHLIDAHHVIPIKQNVQVNDTWPHPVVTISQRTYRYVFSRPISFSMRLHSRSKSTGDKLVSTLQTAFKKRF